MPGAPVRKHGLNAEKRRRLVDQTIAMVTIGKSPTKEQCLWIAMANQAVATAAFCASLERAAQAVSELNESLEALD